jgi:hypothetical protein
LLSLPVGTEMFHFPTFPPRTLCVQVRVTAHDCCRVPPFGNPRIEARLAAPRGLSQPPTSFIGSWCLGIHRVPLITWPQRFKDARVHCAVLKLRAGPHADSAASRARGRAVRAGRPVRRGNRAHEPVPSGPNSVSHDRPGTCLGFPHPEGLYSRATRRRGRTSQSSRPMSTSRA